VVLVAFLAGAVVSCVLIAAFALYLGDRGPSGSERHAAIAFGDFVVSLNYDGKLPLDRADFLSRLEGHNPQARKLVTNHNTAVNWTLIESGASITADDRLLIHVVDFGDEVRSLVCYGDSSVRALDLKQVAFHSERE
jgi:hypothetical protein